MERSPKRSAKGKRRVGPKSELIDCKNFVHIYPSNRSYCIRVVRCSLFTVVHWRTKY